MSLLEDFRRLLRMTARHWVSLVDTITWQMQNYVLDYWIISGLPEKRISSQRLTYWLIILFLKTILNPSKINICISQIPA